MCATGGNNVPMDVNGQEYTVSGGSSTPGGLKVNQGGKYPQESSDFEILEVVTFDRALSREEMKEVYNLMEGSGSCTSCPAGTYNDDNATNPALHADSMACKKCEAGKYGDLKGATNCKICEAGKASHEGSSSCVPATHFWEFRLGSANLTSQINASVADSADGR